jgi:septum formation protein
VNAPDLASRLTIPLILASASPRRRELLATAGIGVTVEPVDADESRFGNETPTAYVARVARLKLEHHLARMDRLSLLDRTETRDAYVLAADTTVAIGNDVLGKPADDADALAMLQRLAGREHHVSTAVAIGRVGHGVVRESVVTTTVRFRDATTESLAAYVATGEGRDKAGGYAIQGIGSGFVLGIEGSYSNVVGLPVAETIAMLLELGALRHWP